MCGNVYNYTLSAVLMNYLEDQNETKIIKTLQKV